MSWHVPAQDIGTAAYLPAHMQPRDVGGGVSGRQLLWGRSREAAHGEWERAEGCFRACKGSKHTPPDLQPPVVPAFPSSLCRSHYITPEQFGVNIDKIIARAKQAGVKHFLIISPPPVCEACKQGKPVSGWCAVCEGQAGLPSGRRLAVHLEGREGASRASR